MEDKEDWIGAVTEVTKRNEDQLKHALEETSYTLGTKQQFTTNFLFSKGILTCRGQITEFSKSTAYIRITDNRYLYENYIHAKHLHETIQDAYDASIKFIELEIEKTEKKLNKLKAMRVRYRGGVDE